MHSLVLFSLAILFSLFTNLSFVEARKNPNGFSIDLIHRDSPLSPFYNSSRIPSELTRNAALRSISRANRVGLSVEENESAETIIIPDKGEYLMKFYIGTPPVERLAFADTGSDLIWIQCSPCQKCFPQNQNTPLFDPKRSSTFMSLSCDSKPCTQLTERQDICRNSSKCIYSYGYGDKSFTMGELGTDSISFGSTGEGQAVSFPKSVFGCGHVNNFTQESTDKTTGLVGLGGGPLSLVSQLGNEIGHKFSYCLLPSTATSPSKLKFGDQAIISGKGVVSTPLITKSSPTFYYLNLEGITVGQKTVKTGESGGNIIIDSGTTLTYLKPSFYNNFVAPIKEMIGVGAVQNPPPPYKFCFRYGPGMNFPNFVFHFTGADVPLDATKNLFSVINDLLCLAVLPTSTENGLSILGNKAQIDIQVEYDLKGKKLSFAPADCTKN